MSNSRGAVQNNPKFYFRMSNSRGAVQKKNK